MPEEVLDKADIETTRSRAAHSGRSHGGAPFRNDYSRPSNHRGNSGNRGNDYGGNSRGGNINYSNPFAAHLNPNFDPNRAPLPPHLAAQQGWLPPPPPQYHDNGRGGGNSRNGPRNGGHGGRGGHGGHGGQGYGHNNRGGYNERDRRDNYGRY